MVAQAHQPLPAKPDVQLSPHPAFPVPLLAQVSHSLQGLPTHPSQPLRSGTGTLCPFPTSFSLEGVGTTSTPLPSLSRDVGDPQVTLFPRSVLRCPVRVFLVLPGEVRWKLRQHLPRLPTTAETGIVSQWRNIPPWGLPSKTFFLWLGFNQSGFTVDGLADRLLVRAPRTHPALWRHATVPLRLSGRSKPLLYSRCFGEVTSLRLGEQRLVGRTGKVFPLPTDSEMASGKSFDGLLAVHVPLDLARNAPMQPFQLRLGEARD